jgi:hypothetical protein
MRYASSFISAIVPFLRIAMTPFRMLLTRCRKNRSPGAPVGFAVRPGRAARRRTVGVEGRCLRSSSVRLGMGEHASARPQSAKRVPGRLNL